MNKFWLFVAVLLFCIPSVLGVFCESYNTPKLFTEGSFELYEGSRFAHQVYSSVIANRTNYTFMNLDDFPGFNISSKGLISFIPNQTDVGIKRVVVIGFADNDCHDSVLITFKVFDKPSLIAWPEAETIKTNEGKGINLRLKVEDSDDESHSVEWFFNDKKVPGGLKFNYLPPFNASGEYDVLVRVTDSKGLSDEAKWKLQVDNINRPPILVEEIPYASVLINSYNRIYDLNNYFRDPDNDLLTFNYETMPSPKDLGFLDAYVEQSLRDGIVSISAGPVTGQKWFVFSATDDSGLKTESNKVQVQVVRSSRHNSLIYCGDDYCSAAETCKSCEKDCGPCDKLCEPVWECEDWGACTISGLKFRVCVDLNECDNKNSEPALAEECSYEASCFDSVLNQDEEGIDCGGTCKACPTCYDEIQNQGEEGKDCGGPCGTCPNCFDNTLNQDESDIDCGGVCDSCSADKFCKSNFDCYSYICEEGICSLASCDDGVQNQGEEGKDCGGPCYPCSDCNDGILNQDEEGIDCGGTCKACPTCYDEIQNQGESLVDCGGPCRKCSLLDYVGFLQFKYFFMVAVLILVLVFIGSRKVKDSMFYMNLRVGGFSSFLEHYHYFGWLKFFNTFFRILSFRRASHKPEAENAISSLEEARSKEDIVICLVGYYKSLLAVSSDPGYDELHNSIKSSSYSFVSKVILVILLKKLGSLTHDEVILDEQLKRIKREAILILSELKKSV